MEQLSHDELVARLRGSNHRRRRLTGRVQVNFNVSRATIDRLTAISDAHHWSFGDTLERAVAALERELGGR